MQRHALRQTIWIKIKYLVIALSFAVLFWIVFSTFSIALYGTYTNEESADGIVVLGAAVFGTEPSPVFRERINHAIELYQNDYAPIIIFTGGKGEGQQIAEAEAARQYAENKGIPSGKILTETTSKTTEQNLYYAKQLMIDQGIEKVIIVSDPLHMKRAMVIAEDMGFEAYSSPTPTTRYKSRQTQLGFLLREVYYYQRYLLRRPFYTFGA